MSHIDLVQRFIHALETGNRATLESCLAPEFRHHDHNDLHPLDREAFITYALNLHAGIPDIRFHLDDVRAGNPVHAQRQVTGTHTDRLDLSPMRDLTLLATRERIRLPVEHVTFEIREERIVAQDVSPAPGGGVEGILRHVGNAMALTHDHTAVPLDAHA